MKAMILINMPEHCGVCEFRGMPWCCTILKKNVSIAVCNRNKPSWCPLQEVPEKKDVTHLGPESYVSGWNDCVDAIKNYN